MERRFLQIEQDWMISKYSWLSLSWLSLYLELMSRSLYAGHSKLFVFSISYFLYVDLFFFFPCEVEIDRVHCNSKFKISLTKAWKTNNSNNLLCEPSFIVCVVQWCVKKYTCFIYCVNTIVKAWFLLLFVCLFVCCCCYYFLLSSLCYSIRTIVCMDIPFQRQWHDNNELQKQGGDWPIANYLTAPYTCVFLKKQTKTKDIRDDTITICLSSFL